jgi:glycosyltransferase
MKVSIITVTYNSEATIHSTLKCIASQDYADIEHIIIDGNSTDSTMEIVKQYPHIKKIVSEPDNGIYHAMNKGLALANGDIIGILNSDDFYVDDKVISKVVEAFVIDRCDAVYSDLVYVDQFDLNKVVRTWHSGAYARYKILHFGWQPPHPTVFFTKRMYEQYGNFNTQLALAADFELLIRFMYKQAIKVTYLSEVTVIMRRGGASNKSIKNRLIQLKEHATAFKVNGIHPPFYMGALRILSKVGQFFKR